MLRQIGFWAVMLFLLVCAAVGVLAPLIRYFQSG